MAKLSENGPLPVALLTERSSYLKGAIYTINGTLIRPRQEHEEYLGSYSFRNLRKIKDITKGKLSIFQSGIRIAEGEKKSVSKIASLFLLHHYANKSLNDLEDMTRIRSYVIKHIFDRYGIPYLTRLESSRRRNSLPKMIPEKDVQKKPREKKPLSEAQISQRRFAASAFRVQRNIEENRRSLIDARLKTNPKPTRSESDMIELLRLCGLYAEDPTTANIGNLYFAEKGGHKWYLEYFDEHGVKRRYLPDFKVIGKMGVIEIIRKSKQPKLERKLEYYKNVGIEYKVYSGIELGDKSQWDRIRKEIIEWIDILENE